MIIVLKQHAPAEQVDSFCHELEDMGYQINDSVGSDTHILGPVSYTHLYSLRLTLVSTPYSEVTGSTCRVP